MQQNNGIHTKVSFDDQFRRFLFNGTEFTSLYNQVSRLLALDNTEFVLKYSDDENDLITISSNEELAFALDFFKFRVLRLHVFKNTSGVKQPAPLVVQPTSETVSEQPGCHWKRGGKCRRGGWNAHAMHKHHHRHMQEGEEGKKRCWESRKEKMTSKRDHFKTLLAEIPTDRQLTADEQDRQRFLQFKVHRIDSCLAKWDECKDRHMQAGEEGQKRCWGSHKERMTSKRDHFKTLLAEIPTDRQLTPDEQDRQRFLQFKVQRIDSRLANWDDCKGMKDRHMQAGEEGQKRCWGSPKERMTSKRDHFKTLLAEIPTDRQLTPDEQDRQRFLQFKIHRIESRLAKCDEFKGRHAQEGEEGKKRCWETRKERITSKRDHLKTLLAEIPIDRQLTADEQDRQRFLQFKVHRVDSCLAKWDDCKGMKDNKDKKEKKERKCAKKWEKKQRKCGKTGRVLSIEQKDEILVLKTQIRSIKPLVKSVKMQIKEKKAAIEAADSKESTDILKSEIVALKEQMVVLKMTIQPLRQRVRDIKFN